MYSIQVAYVSHRWCRGFWLYPAILFLTTVPNIWGQTIPKNGYSILNLAPRSLNLTVWVQTNVIAQFTGPEAIEPGSSTGLLPYRFPPGSLRLETKEYSSLEIPKALQRTGETPLFVLEEKKQGGPLEVLILSNATKRAPVFYDAVNLTSQKLLTIRANNKIMDLPERERIRLTEEKILRYSLGDQPEEILETMENDNFLLVFYEDRSRKIRCLVMRDNLF